MSQYRKGYLFEKKTHLKIGDIISNHKDLKFYGIESRGSKGAADIVFGIYNKRHKIRTWVGIIEKSKRKKNYRVHSSTKTFQALRIFVNKEISELINGLINSAKILKKNGILAVVTFHSLEDKIVKYFFKSLSENKSKS